MIVPNNFYAQGLMALGTLGKEKRLRFTYEAAVSDGLSDKALDDRRGSRQTRDNNSNRALSGRGGFVLWPWAEVGASYHTQRHSTQGDLGLRFFGMDLSARWRGFELRAERVEARLDRQSATGARLPDLRQEGWYGQLSYTLQWDRSFLPSLSLVTRCGRVDLDGAVRGGDDQRYWSLGTNARLFEHFRAKLEYRKADEDGPAKENDTFLSQLVFDF